MTFACFQQIPPYLNTAQGVPDLDSARAVLAGYLNGAHLSPALLGQIIEAGVRALSRADADATTSALRDARNDLAATLNESRAAIAAERDALRRETEQIRSAAVSTAQQMVDRVAQATSTQIAHLHQQINAVSTSLPSNAQQMITPLLERFQNDLEIAAGAIMDPSTGAGSSLTTAVQSLLDTHNSHVTQHFSELNERLGVAEARAEEKTKSSAKGIDFESELESPLSEFAESAQLVLTATGTDQGAKGSSKKGDFVLLDGDVPLVAIEAKNRDRVLPDTQINREIGEMLDNRECSVAVWIVKGRDQNKGALLRQFNDTRWIVAFEEGFEDMLTAVLRLAVAVAKRGRDAATVDDTLARSKVQDAITAAADLDQLQKLTADAANSVGVMERKLFEIRRRVMSSLVSASEALSKD
jgi:F0F1-type ATP synthase membrane subunit b/b'